MKRLLFLALLLATLATLAPAVTVTCPDGRVIQLSPFNQSDPCGELQLEDADVTDEFALLFGPPPQPTGDSLGDRIARVKYTQDRQRFVGLRPTPEAYSRVAAAYERWGFGPVYFYLGCIVWDRDEENCVRSALYARWPEAPVRAARAAAHSALHAPAVIIATWQSDVILQDRVWQPDVHFMVPGWVGRINDELGEALMSGAAPEALGGPPLIDEPCDWVYGPDGLPAACRER